MGSINPYSDDTGFRVGDGLFPDTGGALVVYSQGKPLKKLLTDRNVELEKARSNWLTTCSDIVKYLLPQFYDLRDNQEKDKKIGTEVYDGYPINMLQVMADGMYGYLVSRALNWFRLKMDYDPWNEIPQVREWLDECEIGMYQAFKNSNFYSAIATYLLDGGGLGTASMYVEEDIELDRTVYTNMHPKEIRIAENKFGIVDVMFRKFKLTTRQIYQRCDPSSGPYRWNEKNLSTEIRKSLENNRSEDLFTFIHCVYPNSDRVIGKMGRNNKKYASVWIEDKNPNDGRIVHFSGYDMFPFPTWRWKRVSGPFGIGPGWMALVDVAGLNVMGKTLLNAGQVAVEPPMNVPIGMKDQVQFGARGINYFADPNQIPSPIEVLGNYPIGKDEVKDKRQVVKDHFYVDLFLMLQQMDRHNITATEIMQKQGEKAALLGVVLGNLNTDGLDQIIDLQFDFEMRARRIPPPPDILLEEMYRMGRSGKIGVSYTGPLAQLQNQLFRSQGIMRSLESMGPVLALDAERKVIDNIDLDVVTRELLEINGMPQRAIIPIEFREAIRAQRAKQMQELEQQQKLMMLAEGTKTMAEADRASGGKVSEAMENANAA